MVVTEGEEDREYEEVLAPQRGGIALLDLPIP